MAAYDKTTFYGPVKFGPNGMNLGRDLPIMPGMVATVDIRTGEKTVWDYLVKPFNRAREALRER